MQEVMHWAIAASEVEVAALNLIYPNGSSVINSTKSEWETRLNNLQTEFNAVLESIQPYEALESEGLVKRQIDTSANGASDFEGDLLNALNDKYSSDQIEF